MNSYDGSGLSTSVHYDAAGQLVTMTETPQSDAQPPLAYTFQYDSAARLVGKLGVQANTGVKHSEDTWSYNAKNYIISVQTDTYTDGILSKRSSLTKDVDTQGQIIKRTDTDEILSGGSVGTNNTVTDLSYNAYGEVEQMLEAVTAAGVATLYTTTITRDSSGNPTLTEVVERNVAGSTLSTLRYSYTYDAMGNVTGRTYSKLNAAGAELESNTGTYRFNNEASAVLGGVTRTYRINGSEVGSVQDILTYGTLNLSDITQAASNDLTRLLRIYKRGSAITRSEDSRYKWNAAGYLDTVTVDTTNIAADGKTVTSRTSDSYSFAYDGNRLASKIYDAATDNIPEENTTYTWAALPSLGEYALENTLWFLSDQQLQSSVDMRDDTLPVLFAPAQRATTSSASSAPSSRSNPTLW